MTVNYLLYVESYIVVKTNGKAVLLFNVLNNEKYIINVNDLHPTLNALLIDTVLNSFYKYTEISKSIHFELLNDQTFIALRESFMLDIVVLYNRPIPALISSKPHLQIAAWQNSTKNLFSTFTEIYLYINGIGIEYEHSKLRDYNKQFNFPISTTHSKTNHRELIDLIDIFVKYKVKCINLNLHQWTSIKTFNVFIRTWISLKSTSFKIHVTFMEFHLLQNSIIGCGFIPELCYVYFFELIQHKDRINEVLEFCNIDSRDIQFVFCLIIEDTKEYSHAEKLSYSFPHHTFQFLPYIDGENEYFLDHYIKYTVDDLFNVNHSLRNISVNESLNAYFYDKISIDANGDLFTSFNLDKIGNIFEKNLKIKEKLHNIHSIWFLTRNKVKPCIDCLFNCFCPPINDINLHLKSFDLCIKEKTTFQNERTN